MPPRDAFRRAFAAAQRSGQRTFEFGGVLYPTETRDPDDPPVLVEPMQVQSKSEVASGVFDNGSAGQIDYFAVAAFPYNTESEMQW